MPFIFWFSIFMIFYAYFGYPICLWIVAAAKTRKIKKQTITPTVWLVISAYNEEKVLAQKIENSLLLDYPENLLKIAIISDGSTDGTNAIIRKYEEKDKRVVSYVSPSNKGKTACLNDIVPNLGGEIVLFSDANAFYEKDLIRKIVRSFADEKVGFVTGSTKYFSSLEGEHVEATSLYSKLEKLAKKFESQICSCVGADGAVFAIRKDLYVPPPPYGMNDFEIPLSIIEKGYRGVLDEEVFCREECSSSVKVEFHRQKRITSRTIRAILSHRRLLNPFRQPIFCFQLVSHKLLKFLVPLFMILLGVSNVVLAIRGEAFFQVCLVLQTVFYGGAILALAVPTEFKIGKLLGILESFVITNAAIFCGWVSYLSGEKYGAWLPPRG